MAFLFKRFLFTLKDVVEGEWNLSVSLPSPRYGNLHRLASILNVFLKRLQTTITNIATTAIKVSKVAPDLSSLAQTLESGSKDQADRAVNITAAIQEIASGVHEIAQNPQEAAAFAEQVSRAASDMRKFGEKSESQMVEMENVVHELAEAIRILKESSVNIRQIMDLIKEVADQTKLLSLNAAIEAARAGEHGLGFAVIAQEIRKLADQTMEGARDVVEILTTIRESITRSADAVDRVNLNIQKGHEITASSQRCLDEVQHHLIILDELVRKIAAAGIEQDKSVQQVSRDILSITETAQQQTRRASHLSQAAGSIRECCDELLMSVGVFRLSAHQKARAVIEEISKHPDLLSMDRQKQEAFLHEIINQHPFFELMYVTNADGVQVTENIAVSSFKAAYGSTGLGENWSERSWFGEAVNRKKAYISDIYRSLASDNFCFTISTPLWSSRGILVGVLGADVHFADILSI